MMRRSRSLFESVWPIAIQFMAFPFIVCVSAMTLLTAVALIAMQLDLHTNPDRFLALVLSLAAIVMVPMTVLAGFREYKNFQGRLLLERFATTDPLTGVLNRRAFKDAVAEQQLRIRRNGLSAAILLFDLDHFKQVNDKHGHSIGDQVLKRVTELAYKELRGPFDRLGRWGGEEFIVLLNEVSLYQAQNVAERLRLVISNFEYQTENGIVRVTASFGVAVVSNEVEFTTVLSDADRALYRAKSDGRNRVIGPQNAQMAA